jgi:cell division protein FtsI/penicillin-binding protein 2
MRNKRLTALIILILILALAVIVRLIDLQIIRHKGYKEKALEQRQRIIKLAADRGDIYDRNGRLLATSLDTYSVYVNPRVFIDYKKLSKLLGEKISPYPRNRYFAWVKRKIGKDLAGKIEKGKMPGLGLLPEKKRVYPKGSLASQVLGFVGLDNEGLSGIELSYDEYLKGKEGRIITESDPRGYELLSGQEEEITKVSPGMDLTLTIDESIQYIAEKELEKAVKKYQAYQGFLAVMDVKSGELLALAGKPDFDPNYYYRSDPLTWKSFAVDVYEPGSTFKVITVAAGLNERIISEKTELKALESLKVADRIIRNSHDEEWTGSTVTLSKMLERSINTAAAQIGLKLGSKRFFRQIKDFGFGERTNAGLPSESRGILKEPSKWYKIDEATISFGQGIAVTPLQLIAAYASIGNQGERVRPYLVKKIESLDGRFIKTFDTEDLGRSTSKENAELLKELMASVAEEGTGKRAETRYYRVAGKTGTSQKAGPRGRYLKDQYIASFVGFAPLKDPRLAVLVIIDRPKKTIWGGAVAAPVFSSVAGQSLRYLNVPADVL